MDVLVISVNEAARVLGVGRTSLYDMIRDGRIETLKLGRRTLIKTASIRSLVEDDRQR
jgi:excisionase family DNA binding protein